MNKTTLYILVALILVLGGAYVLWGSSLWQFGSTATSTPQANLGTGTTTGSATSTNQTESMTLTGTIVCLPHKPGSDFYTLECAFGLKTDDGKHYAITGLSDIATGTDAGIDTGIRVRLVGDLDTTTAASSNYDIVGTLDVITAEKLSVN